MLQGGFVSNLGDVLYSLAIGYYVYQRTGSGAALGIFTSITLFAEMLLSPVAGAIVCHINRKRTLVFMDAVRGGIMLLIGGLCLGEILSINTLFGSAVLIALAGVLFGPCSDTILMDVVPAQELLRAKSLESSLQSIVTLIGKAISGFALVFFGVGWLIICNGVSFLCSAITECFITLPYLASEKSSNDSAAILQDLKQGAITVKSQPGLNVLFFSLLFINLAASGALSLLLVFTQQQGYSVEQYGLLASALSIGGVIGASLIAASKIAARRRGPVALLSLLLSASLFAAAFLVRQFSASFLLFCAAAFFNIISNVIMNSTMMLALPEQQRSTIIGIITASSAGGSALSSLLYGFLVEWFPLSYVGAVGMLVSLLAMLPMLRSKSAMAVLSAHYTP